MPSICKNCVQPITKKSPGIECMGSCDYSFHLKCVNISIEQHKSITSTPGTVWKCSSCLFNDSAKRFSVNSNTSTSRLSSGAGTEGTSSKTEDVSSSLREMRAELRTFAQKQDDLIASIGFCCGKIDDFEAPLRNIGNFMKQFEILQEENKSLKKRVNTLEGRLNDLEQHSRMNNLEIQGVPERKDEQVFETVEKIISFLGEDATGKVTTAHRVQTVKTNNKFPKNIIVEFNSRQFRDKVLTLAKQKRNRSQGPGLKIEELGDSIFINEHLTPNNKTLFREAREWAKANNFKYVWVKNGNVLMRKDDISRVKHIKDMTSLEK